MKMKPSTKIAIGAIVIGALGYGGSKLSTTYRLKDVKLTPISTTDFCLLALEDGAKVRVLVANRMAQLVEADGDFSNQSSEEGGAQSGSIKRRIPIKELLQILDGNGSGIDFFINRMGDNGGTQDGLDDAPIWKLEDIEKAISGDAKLKTQLENDLNCTLEGALLPTLNTATFQIGIRVGVPVTLNVNNVSGPTVSGIRYVPFRVREIMAFAKKMEQKFYSKDTIQAEYAAFKKISEASGSNPENVALTLQAIKSSALDSSEISSVERICKHTKVLANRSMIEKVSLETKKANGNTSYSIKLWLTDEAVSRLWKFSSQGGQKIIVVAKGVPIAAASIATELNSKELVIDQVTDEKLAQSAVELFRK
jgi:hypothetical protein